MFTVRFFLKILLLLLICESMSAQESNPISIPGESIRKPDPIRIAWMVYRDRENRSEDFNALGNYLSGQIGRPVKIQTVYNYDYQSVLRRMSAQNRARDRVDIAFFTPYTYVLAHQVNPKIKAFLTYKLKLEEEDGKKEYRCYFVWKRNSGSLENVLQQLRSGKKRLAYVNRYSTSGYIWPVTWLRTKHDIDIDRDNVRMYKSRGHFNSLRQLRYNSAIIAAGVWEVDFIRFLQDSNLSVDVFQKVEIPPPIPNDPMAIRGGFTIEEENQIKDAFLGMDTDPEGREILRRDIFKKIVRWDLTDDTAYNPVRIFNGIPFPAQSLRLQTDSPVNDTMVSTFTRELQEALSDGWFKLAIPDDEAVDISLDYHIKRGVDSIGVYLRVQACTNDDTIDEKKTFIRKNVTDLAQVTSNYLKQLFPLEGYISERDSKLPQPGIIVKLTKRQGIKKYLPVEIIKSAWSMGQPEQKDTIYAYVSGVNSCRSCLTPFSEKDVEKIRLNVFDKIFYRARILGPEMPPDRIIIRPEDVNLSDEGDFVVDFFVEIYENDSKAKAGKSGLGLFVKARSSRLIINGQRSDKVEGRIYIPPGKSESEFSIVLSNALRDKISVSLIHPREKETIKKIWCTVIWRFFTWAFIGGLIGGLIKFVGTLHQSKPDFKPRLVKAAIDIFFGIVVGGVLLIILLLLPNLVGQLPAVAQLVKGAPGRLLIGIIGGIIGAPGLSSGVLKKFFNLKFDTRESTSKSKLRKAR